MGQPKEITIYTWTVCPYCVRAKRLLESKGFQYNEINLDGKDEELQKLRERTGFRTIPQIFIGSDFVGGYSELAALESSGKLQQMMGS